MGEVPHGGGATWERCHMGEVPHEEGATWGYANCFYKEISCEGQ